MHLEWDKYHIIEQNLLFCLKTNPKNSFKNLYGSLLPCKMVLGSLITEYSFSQPTDVPNDKLLLHVSIAKLVPTKCSHFHFTTQRQEYHLLLSQASLPVKVVKMFLVGDEMAGKTTLKKTLTMVSIYANYCINNRKQEN